MSAGSERPLTAERPSHLVDGRHADVPQVQRVDGLQLHPFLEEPFSHVDHSGLQLDPIQKLVLDLKRQSELMRFYLFEKRERGVGVVLHATEGFHAACCRKTLSGL